MLTFTRVISILLYSNWRPIIYTIDPIFRFQIVHRYEFMIDFDTFFWRMHSAFLFFCSFSFQLFTSEMKQRPFTIIYYRSFTVIEQTKITHFSRISSSRRQRQSNNHLACLFQLVHIQMGEKLSRFQNLLFPIQRFLMWWYNLN